MCSARRAARRAAAQATADAQAAMAKQEQQFNEMLSMVPKAPEYTPPPAATRSSTDETGVRTAKSKRKSTLRTNKGLASLRIPLNTGGPNSGGGINVG